MIPREFYQSGKLFISIAIFINMLHADPGICIASSDKPKNRKENPTVLNQGTRQLSEQDLDLLKVFDSKTKKKSFRLANNLNVLLVSNPHRHKASAVVELGVGSLAEPETHRGMAHFLEHLLFLGTSKYPEVDGYKKHIDKYQGYDNAFTSREHTNYHFTINHDGFEEALDRFAYFFIEPAFHSEFVDKERKAVNDEAVMLKDKDVWRNMILYSRLMSHGHPLQRYHPGDAETLKNVNREHVKEFYESNYSASDMNLVLDSRFPLEKMEEWVREKFVKIVDKGNKKGEYGKDLFAAGQLPKFVEIAPIKQDRTLVLKFATGNLDNHWKSKPDFVISHLVGHEGQGSLLSSLKKDNLALSLSAGFEQHSFASIFDVTIELTPSGLDKVNTVIERFFSYIEFLKSHELPKYVFDELSNMAMIEYKYSNDNDSEGVQQAIASAHYMSRFPSLKIDQRSRLLYEFDPHVFKQVLEGIDSANAVIILANPDAKTDSIEPDFQTPFRHVDINSNMLKSWNNPRKFADISYPLENKFIPSKLELLPAYSEGNPEKIIDNKWGSFWFKNDQKIKLPKAELRLLIKTPFVNLDPHHKALGQLYIFALEEYLNEWKYQVSLAGMSYSIYSVNTGIEIRVSGLSENLLAVLEELLMRTKKIDIEKDKFLTYQNSLGEKFSNFLKDPPYQQAYFELNHLVSAGDIPIRAMLDPEKKVNLFQELKYDEFFDYIKKLFASISVEGFAYGNLDRGQLVRSIERIPQILDSSALEAKDIPQSKVINIKPEEPKVSNFKTQLDNHCFGKVIQIGPLEAKADAIIRIGVAFLEQHFFNSLRTVKKLGYVVSCRRFYKQDHMGLSFLVQSSSHSSQTIDGIIKEWSKEGLQDLGSLPSEIFDQYKSSVVDELLQEKNDIHDIFAQLDHSIFYNNGIFNYHEQVAQAAQDLQLKDVLEMFEQFLLKGRGGSACVHFEAK